VTDTANIDAIDVTGLYVEHIHAKPTERDWSKGYPEDWDYEEADTCSECGHAVACNGMSGSCTNEDCELFEQDQEFETAEGPMMNYSYPLEQGFATHEHDVRVLDGLPLCIVRFENGDQELALTGGGMDLSWEICEAYIRLGYLPPLHFADLPRMGSRGQSDRDQRIVEACIRSAEIASSWTLRTKDRLVEQYG
jgi:hypothetical protein